MSNSVRALCAGVVLAGNFVGAACVTFFAWLSAVWMTGDSAAIWTTWQWAVAASQRALYWAVIAAIVVVIAAFLNGLLLLRVFPERRLLPWYVAGADGLMIALGGLVGSVQFFIQKPFM